jgi:PDDEXK-like uncharacterized protein DUF3799
MAAKYISGGVGELSMLWTYTAPTIGGLEGYSVNCKGRIDFATGAGVIVDLKTCRSAAPEKFQRDSWGFKYHTQAAFYVDGYKAATGRELSCVVVAVEAKPPYVVQVRPLDQELIDAGREEYRRLLDHRNLCLTTGNWPGYADGEVALSIPPFARPRDEEDPTGLGLVFSEENADGL